MESQEKKQTERLMIWKVFHISFPTARREMSVQLAIMTAYAATYPHYTTGEDGMSEGFRRHGERKRCPPLIAAKSLLTTDSHNAPSHRLGRCHHVMHGRKLERVGAISSRLQP